MLGGPGVRVEGVLFVEVCRRLTSTVTCLPAPNSATSCMEDRKRRVVRWKRGRKRRRMVR